MAFDVFRSTLAQLQSSLPTWKRPLLTPIQREATNPFTGQTALGWSYDPEPTREVEDAPAAPPGPSVDLAGLDLFGPLALVSVLLPADADEIRRALFLPDASQTNAHERVPVLIGPADGPWLWALPAPLTSRLATMTDAEICEAGPRFAAQFRAETKRLDPNTTDVLADDFYADALRRLCGLAHEAAAHDERLFEWVAPDW